MDSLPADAAPIDRLLAIMARLRGPDGCPWDREQTPATLKPYILEEACEVLDALDEGDPDKLADELGDLLLQVVFQAQLASEAEQFDFHDVARAIADKLVRRHPHVFGDVRVESSGEVIRNWNSIKEAESDAPAQSVLDGVPQSLPSLQRARELQKKAARVGFDWPSPDPVHEKIREELDEFFDALEGGDSEASEEEFGDLLFSLVNLGRKLHLHPELALRRAATKFENRFRALERRVEASGRTLEGCSLEELDAEWNAVKQQAARREEGRRDES